MLPRQILRLVEQRIPSPGFRIDQWSYPEIGFGLLCLLFWSPLAGQDRSRHLGIRQQRSQVSRY